MFPQLELTHWTAIANAIKEQIEKGKDVEELTLALDQVQSHVNDLKYVENELPF